MADGGGFGAKMGVRTLAGWGSAYAAPTALIPFTKETLSKVAIRIEDESLVGTASRGASVEGGWTVGGTTEHMLDYNNFDTLFELAMGAVASRVFTISDDDLPKFGLVEFEKTIQRHRYYPLKVSGFTISGQANQPVKITYKYVIRKRDLSGTAFPAIATPGARNLVQFAHLNFQIGDQADALAGGDGIGIASFEIEFDRQLKTDDYESSTTPKEILEAVPGDWRVGNIKIATARYNAANAGLVTFKENDTPLQMKFLFSGSGETALFEFPNIRITEGFDAPVEGPGPMKLEGTFQSSPSLAGNPMYVGNEMRATFT
jgi:hypothetical protein